MKYVLLFAVLLVALLAYIRLAPGDPLRWHVDPLNAADPGTRGVLRQYKAAIAAPLALRRLDAIAGAHPRTEVLAGSVDEGHITYVIRSKWFGFPDYFTVKVAGDALVILSRLRFGRSDTGVNRARLAGWLQRLQAVDD